MSEHIEKIISVANAMLSSDGRDKAGASTGEQIAGALLAGRPEWAGFTNASGYTDVPAMIERLGPEWLELVREAQGRVEFSSE
jgi:hypothetical protein